MFERRWHWFEANVGRSVALTADGGYVIGAGTRISGNNFGATLVWVDSLGDTVTVRHVSGLDNGAGHLCRVNDGGYVVAGTHDSLHVFAHKFNAAGDSVWTYSSPTRGLVQAVISTADGGCLIVGRIPDSMYQPGVVKLDSAGHEEWTRYYYDPGVTYSIARGATQTRDGGYILCGDAQGYMDTYTRFVRTDSAGRQIWSRLYSGAVDAHLYDVTETSDSGFFAAGSEWDTLQPQYALYLVRTDSSGTTIWTRSYSLAGAGTQASAMDATRDGGYAIAATLDWGDSARAWLVKIDANADTLWTSVLPGTGREQAADVRQTADGGYVIAGTSDSAGGSVLLVKTDSLGGTTIGVAEGKLPCGERIVFSVTPNPARGAVRIVYSLPRSGRANLRMYDVTGHRVHSSFGLRPSSFLLALGSMPAGVYVLRLDSDLGSATRRLVIE